MLKALRRLFSEPPKPVHGDWYFGGCPMLLKAAKEHTLIVGTTGSGKTTVMKMWRRDLLPLVAKDTLGLCRAVDYDAKRDLYSFYATIGVQDRVQILNPLDARCVRWDLAVDIATPASAAALAQILCPEENDSNPYFIRAARNILKDCLVAFQIRAPGRWDLRDVILAFRNQELLKAILNTPRTRDTIGLYFNEKANIWAILATAATKFTPHEVTAACWHHAKGSFSIQTWIRGSSIVLLPNDEANRASLDPLNLLLFQRMTEELLEFGVSDERLTLFFMDEFRELGRVHVRPLLTKGRAYGIACFLGYQSNRGLEAELKSEAEADEIAGLCAQRVFLRLQDASADWAAKCLGEADWFDPQEGYTTSSNGNSSQVTWVRTTRPVITASEIRSTPLPTPQHGLLGTYDCSRIGVWQMVYHLGSWPRYPTREERTAHPDYVPRPVSHQILEPFGPSDFERLQIKPPAQPASQLVFKPKPPALELVKTVPTTP